MIRHHVTLQRMAEELSQLLEGATLREAWTQAKDVACFVFVNHSHLHYVECDLRPLAGTFFIRHTLRRANHNTIDLFQQACNQRVACVVKHSNDRVISIIFESCQIHAELFSGGSGNIVLVQDDLVADALHDKRNRMGIPYHSREMSPSSTKVSNQTSTYRALVGMFPTLGKWYAKEACNRLAIDPDVPYSQLLEQQASDITAMSRCVINEAETSSQWYVLSLHDEIVLSPLVLLNSNVLATFERVLPAIAKTLALRNQRDVFAEQRLQAIRALTKQIKKVRATLHHLEQDKLRDTRADDYKRYGDLLMSERDLQQRNQQRINLVDWDTQTEVTISLNPDLSLLENAQRYYEKSRLSQRSSRERERRLPSLMMQLQELEAYLHKTESAITYSELPQLPQSMLRMTTSQQTKSPEEEYRVFRLDDTHTLYVGKSAANNDQLTMKFAKQQDWWMHVRGASGSHAVLKGVAGPKIPKEILERAAAITAYYSQARNASYVPVVYTQRKHVRKPKGANIGAVTIEREQTIMVKPAPPGE